MGDKKKHPLVGSSFALIVVFVCLSLVGIALVPLLPVKLSPSRDMPGLSVSFSMPGHSARVVETEVTSRLEGMLSRVNGIKNITSTSDNGSGSISIELDRHADIDATRFEVSTLIRQLWSQLPDGVSYPLISTQRSDDDASRPFMTYTLNAPATPIVIQKYGEERIKPLLSALSGVYKVELSGATPMEWRIVYDNVQLERTGISVQDILDAITERYGREFLGICEMEKDGGSEWIRLVRTTEGSADGFVPSEIAVRSGDGSLVPLDRLVRVTRTEQEPTSYYRINGLNSVYLSITASESANQLALAKEVRKVIAEAEAVMPAGYEIHTGYDATEYISKELNVIYFRTGITVLILLLFVAVITRNMRYLFLIVTGLTVNIAVAAILYYAFGLEIQLYSLAGITISLSLVIDNIIVMTDHILRRHNLKAFMSVLAATLTTLGALVIIFFLDEKIRLNLQDFAAVVIINLGVSLFVALFFVPPMIEKIGLAEGKPRRIRLWVKRGTVYFTRFYRGMIVLLSRYRIIAFLLLALGFGGSLYQFTEKVYDGRYFNRDESEVVLSINATLPNGSTLEQMNVLIKKMETYLSRFHEIRQFQTSVYNARRANIQVYFKKEYSHTGFPYLLKSDVISQSLTLGGGSWSVYGLQDQGFSNDVREMAGNFRVKMYGYNYDELDHWAEEMKKQLLTHRRIKDVTISSEFSWWKDDYTEFYLEFDKRRMAEENLTAYDLFAVLRPVFMRDQLAGSILYDNSLEYLRLSSRQSSDYDVWAFMSVPFVVNGKQYKLSDLAVLVKSQAPKQVAKENQQYRLCLQYEYIGSSEQGRQLLEKDIDLFKKRLPMGYTVESEDSSWSWDKEDNGQYWLLLIVIAIIFFISAILFNSLSQPLAIIFVIPISYIGVFLTFYLFGLNFDQGGFASFVLLCGITVNASIYILNEYNAIRRNFPRLSPLRAYTKAWNVKVIPIFLTVTSTILGFVPFLIGDKTPFWFPLAAGTIGGLVMSVVGIFIFLPVLSVSGTIRKL
jgi:multidrug efflux pump subunit AcrB